MDLFGLTSQYATIVKCLMCFRTQSSMAYEDKDFKMHMLILPNLNSSSEFLEKYD
jgi:hypothetical protein